MVLVFGSAVDAVGCSVLGFDGSKDLLSDAGVGVMSSGRLCVSGAKSPFDVCSKFGLLCSVDAKGALGVSAAPSSIMFWTGVWSDGTDFDSPAAPVVSCGLETIPLLLFVVGVVDVESVGSSGIVDSEPFGVGSCVDGFVSPCPLSAGVDVSVEGFVSSNFASAGIVELGGIFLAGWSFAAAEPVGLVGVVGFVVLGDFFSAVCF